MNKIEKLITELCPNGVEFPSTGSGNGHGNGTVIEQHTAVIEPVEMTVTANNKGGKQ